MCESHVSRYRTDVTSGHLIGGTRDTTEKRMLCCVEPADNTRV
ncbi:MAG TPA: hypothetical protein PLF23_07275 [Candidatus Obscuribacter sp.]|nr:hypothetical protein [Candidatus Obscuribacter sp.]